MLTGMRAPHWRSPMLDGAAVLGFAALSIVFYTVNLWAARSIEGGGAEASAPLVAIIVVLLVVQACALWWRSRRPVVVFAVVFGLFVVMTLLDGSRDQSAGPTLWFAVFAVAAYASGRAAWVAIGGASIIDCALQLAMLASGAGATPLPWPAAVVEIVVKAAAVYTVCSLLGAWFGLQRRRTEFAAERTRLLQREHDAQVTTAIALERNRMARELHDVAAHHLTGIIVQTKAALQIHTSDHTTTEQLLESIRDQGQATLDNLRQVVGILRHDTSGETLPQPTVDAVTELAESLRHMNPNIAIRIDGETRDLTPAASMTCYRIIQESLSNAQKHSPGASIEALLLRDSEKVSVRVENRRPPISPSRGEDGSDTGYGLLGMRERVLMLGGTLEAGKTADGGWLTSATIPVEGNTTA